MQLVEEVVTFATDPDLDVQSATAKIVEAMATDNVLRELLASPSLATLFGSEVCSAAGPERTVALAGAMEERVQEHPDLTMPAMALAEEAGDVEFAGRIAERALSAAAPGDHADQLGDVAAELLAIRRGEGRLGDALELAEQWCARIPEDESLQQQRARLLARLAALEGDDPTLDGIFTDVVPDEQRRRALAARDRFANRTLLYS
ncbi:MAG: hypothetical protein ACRDYC_04465, partial [Acidimicrobiales bacterium]